jgi:GDP-mannose 6-dehydrogenase
MNISVFGLGYVGCVSVGCLSSVGHNIIGVDINSEKLEAINNGKSTVIESGLDELISNGVTNGSIKTTNDLSYAVNNSEIAIICVGTPNDKFGFLEMKYVENVVESIAKELSFKKFFTISIRSTVMPGTNDRLCKLVEGISGKKNNKDFGIVSNPEFLREGSAIKDFFSPPYTVLGSNCERSISQMTELYGFLNSPFEIVDIKVAELIKFLNNSFHALKVAFGNEIGRLSSSLELGDNKLIELFLKDTDLNISDKYFTPGFSYGGSCLPKDLKALNAISQSEAIDLPILNNVELSNSIHTYHIINKILSYNINKIGLYGLAFKSNTDDLRFSKSIDVCELLIGKGMNIKVYDKAVNTSKLIGSNKEFLNSKLPHINNLLVDSVDNLCEYSKLLVLVHKPSQDETQKIIAFLNNTKNIVLDSSINNDFKKYSNYHGINW